MHSPSKPKFPPVKAAPSPRPREAVLETVKDDERRQLKKRRGYMSTVLTRGGLGIANTQKSRVTGL